MKIKTLKIRASAEGSVKTGNKARAFLNKRRRLPVDIGYITAADNFGLKVLIHHKTAPIIIPLKPLTVFITKLKRS